LEELKGCPTEGVFVKLDPTILEKLLKRCKSEQTTLHGAIMAALARISPHYVPKSCVNRIHNVVDVRNLSKKIEIDNHQVGDWIAGVNIDFIPPFPEFWQLSRYAREKLVKGIPHAIEMIGTMEFIAKDKWESMWNRQRSLHVNGKRSTISVSNLGVWNAQNNYGNVKVLGCIFSVGSCAVGGLMSMAVVTYDGNLCISVTYSPILISKQQIEIIVNLFQKELISAVQ